MWVKIDDRIVDHPKMYAAARHLGRHGHVRAFSVYVAGLCYANSHLTDGVLTKAVIASFRIDRKPLDVAAVLAYDDVRLWESIENGYRIHDYHVMNPTADEIKIKRDWDAKRKQLYSIPGLIPAIRRRDRDLCRYCRALVNWNDRRSDRGGTYDHVIPRGDNSLENVVVCCYRCNVKKGGRTPDEANMRLLEPPDGGPGTSSDPVSGEVGSSQNHVSRVRARAGSPDPDPSTKDRDHAALRASGCGKPVENAGRVLKALIWTEVREIFRLGPPMVLDAITRRARIDEFEIRERLKDTAARAGLLYAVDDFHETATRAITRCARDAGDRDRNRSARRSRSKAARC